MRLSPHITVMQNAAQKAARRLLRDFGEVEMLQVSIKGPGDFVSQADLRAEQVIREELTKARPGYAFLMEEGGASGSENWTWRWVVDPLDGTSNFLHGIPQWAISIGLERRLSETTSEVEAAVVYNPAGNEMFWAEKGSGAFLNDRRIRVSSRKDMSEALFSTGIPFAVSPRSTHKPFLKAVEALMPQVAGIRRFGSAALDLAWLAAGRYDGFWEFNLKPWDCAAGLLLVKEAGGYTSTPAGKDLALTPTMDIVAGNPHLHLKLRKIIAAAMES